MGYNGEKKFNQKPKLKAIYHKDKNENFMNPYNFVPTTAPLQNINAEEVEGNTHKGYFTCQLITKTPLAIPDVAKKYGKEHDKYPFMTLGNKQMIPGSSVRGVIRNIYETATNSCMITVAGDDVITARADSRKAFKPGLLIKDDTDKWTLYSAKRVPLVIEDVLHKPMDKRYKSFKNENPYNNKSGTPEWQGSIKLNGVTYNWGDPVWVDDSGENHIKVDRRGKPMVDRNGKPVEPWKCSAKDICPIKNGETQKPGYKKGYLYLGEAISNKHAESVFIQGGPVPVKGEAPDYIKRLDEIYVAYNDKAINRNLNAKMEKGSKPHFGYQGYSRAKKNGVIPIWYEQTKDLKIHVSFAAIGRMAYDNSFSKIPNVGRACRSRTKVCKACALFGMVGDKNLGSKVRFTDAIVTGEARVKHSVILKELGSPKPSYLSFYTTGGATYDDKGIEVRGRKFYWHNPKAANDPSVYTNKGEDVSRSSEMELLDTGSKFEFKVYYDGITDEQLETLAWALTLGDNDPSSKYCIKIGHGKPIGLGSSKIIITECVERNVDVTNGSYSVTDVSKEDLTKYIESGKNLVSKNIGYRELMQIADFNGAQGLEVRYPYIKYNGKPNGQNDIASHQWFTKNKADNVLLPNINEANKKPLHPYQLSYEEKSQGNNFKKR